MCALYEVKSMSKNPPSTTAVAASIRKDQEPAGLGRTGCTKSTDCNDCTVCTDCIGCTECRELACVADAKRERGGGGGREKRAKGKREGSTRYKSWCFCIPSTIFSLTNFVKEQGSK